MYKLHVKIISFFCLFCFTLLVFSQEAETEIVKELVDETTVEIAGNSDKTIYYENYHGNKLLTFISTVAFFLLMGYIAYKRKTYLSVLVIASIPILIVLIPFSFSELIINAKELHIRNTGKKVRAEISYSEEYKKVRAYRYITEMRYVPIYSFSYLSDDGVKQTFSGRYSRIEYKDLYYDSEKMRTDIIICVSKKGNEAVLLLPRHTQNNVVYVVVSALILLLTLLFYIGIFDKAVNKLSKHFKSPEEIYKQKNKSAY